jgi:two-component system phosphate regulon sensor histidine kinase PhoR
MKKSLPKAILIQYITFGAGGSALLAGLLCTLIGTSGTVLLLCYALGLSACGAAAWISLQLNNEITRLGSVLMSAEKETFHFRSGYGLQFLVHAVKSFLTKVTEKSSSCEEQVADMNLQLQLRQKQKRNMEEIIYSIRDAVLVVDSFDRVIVANAAARTLFHVEQYNPQQPRKMDDLITCRELIQLIGKSRKSESQHVRHEIRITMGSDDIRTYDCILSCVKDENGQVNDVVAVLHDITKEKEISQMKNDFVSHVSHELKTPLASINAYAEMLVDGEAEDAETIREFCGIIQTQAQRLNRLIEDILNISRIESGLVKVAKEKISMAMLVRDATEMIKSYAQEKNITVDADAPILFDQVYADKDMMFQVVINLLSNAVKYTPTNGQVTIRSEVNEADGYIRVTVADTGVGIPPEDVDHVFDKFFRVEANKKVAKGTGLGLNLVKQIVEKVHDGRVFVTSAVNEGSTFGFELPLTTAQAVEV